MVHREFGRSHGMWWKVGRDLLFTVAVAGAGSALFILGELAVYGHVHW